MFVTVRRVKRDEEGFFLRASKTCKHFDYVREIRRTDKGADLIWYNGDVIYSVDKCSQVMEVEFQETDWVQTDR